MASSATGSGSQLSGDSFSRKQKRMLPEALEGPEVIGMLARTVPTRLIDISRTGCLLESRHRVDAGTVGELCLQLHADTFVDDVRVTRCVLVEGSGSVYLVGAEFIQTHRPGERSIRRAITGILRGPAGPTAALRESRKRTVVNSVQSKGEEAS
jgi:PilZ domain